MHLELNIRVHLAKSIGADCNYSPLNVELEHAGSSFFATFRRGNLGLGCSCSFSVSLSLDLCFNSCFGFSFDLRLGFSFNSCFSFCFGSFGSKFLFFGFFRC